MSCVTKVILIRHVLHFQGLTKLRHHVLQGLPKSKDISKDLEELMFLHEGDLWISENVDLCVNLKDNLNYQKKDL